MEMHEAMNDVLNDLVMINNDRIASYEKAIEEAKGMDIDLKATFRSMITQSVAYKLELTQMIEAHGGIVEDDTTSAGKIYRAWMDIKSAITDSSRNSILASCEFNEDATQRAYEAALGSGHLIDEAARKLVEDEQNSLKKSHELIKNQHEAHKLLPQ